MRLAPLTHGRKNIQAYALSETERSKGRRTIHSEDEVDNELGRQLNRTQSTQARPIISSRPRYRILRPCRVTSADPWRDFQIGAVRRTGVNEVS